MYAKIVHIYLNVQKSKNHVKLITRHMGKLYGGNVKMLPSYFGNKKLYASNMHRKLKAYAYKVHRASAIRIAGFSILKKQKPNSHLHPGLFRKPHDMSGYQ